MQEPREFLGALFKSVRTSMRTPIVLDIYGDAVDMIAARDVEIRRDAFEAGYAQGHNDTVEGCTRDMHDAANDYIAAITGEEE